MLLSGTNGGVAKLDNTRRGSVPVAATLCCALENCVRLLSVLTAEQKGAGTQVTTPLIALSGVTASVYAHVQAHRVVPMCADFVKVRN